MNIIVYILILCYPSFALAEINENLFLPKKTPAPYDGFLISEYTAEKLYRLNFDYDILEKKFNINEKIIENKTNQINLLTKDNQDLAKSLAAADSRHQTTLIITIVGTVLGVSLLTFLVVYAVKTANDIYSKPVSLENKQPALIRF